MTLKNIVTVSEDLTYMLRRFPLAVLMVGLLTLGILAVIHLNFNELSDFERYVAAPIFAGYLSVNIYLVGEGRGRAVSLPLHISVLIAALAVSWFQETLRFNIWMGIGAAVLYLGSAPFLRKAQDNDSAWDFTHRIWVGAIFATAGSILFTLGLLFINEAVRALFDIKLNDLLFEWIMPVALAGLAPLYWLSTIDNPNSLSSEDSLSQPGFISRAVGFMGVWLLAPLVLVFAAILLAYLVQIIMRGELPDGETAGLVTPFIIIGTLTWLVLDPAFIREKRIAKIFRALWFWAMIPAALLLAASVLVRINEYGLTPPRYLLALCVIWAVLISLWAIIRKKGQRDLRMIPSLAALLLALGSIGPLGAYGLSSIHQKARVNSVINMADIITVDGVFKAKADLPELTDEQKRKLGGLIYLYQSGDKSWVKNRFAKDDPVFLKQNNSPEAAKNTAVYEPTSFTFRASINERFNLNRNEGRRFINVPMNQSPIGISGYTHYIGQIYFRAAMNMSPVANTSLSLSVEGNLMDITEGDQTVARFDFAKLIDVNQKEGEELQLSSDIYPFETLGDSDWDYGFIFMHLNHQISRDDTGQFSGEMIVFRKPRAP